jgi:hypothetical protein
MKTDNYIYINSSYAKEANKPATKPRMGDLCIFIGHIVVSVKPTLSIRAETDYLLLAEKYSDVIKRAFKNR